MSLSITQNSVQALSDEELASYHKILMDHIRKISRLDAAALKDDLKVTSGEKVPVFEVTVRTLLETREAKLEPVVRPCPPDFKPSGEAPLTKDKINIWDYPSEAREDFSPHRGSYLIPATQQAKDCKDCLQKGQSSCKDCFGKGEVNCEVCLGAGSQQCHFCKGQGKTACLKCDGQGKFSAPGMTNKVTGACEACNGTGKFPCTRCVKGKIDCTACGTTGKKPCETCEGKGQIVCKTCKGAKKFLTGLAFASEFRSAESSGRFSVGAMSKVVLDLALSQKEPAGDLEAGLGGSLQKEIESAPLPDSIMTSFSEVVKKAAPLNTVTTRTVRQKLTLSEGEIVCVKGLYANQEFVYWIQPKADQGNIYAEKDPLANLGESAAGVAQQAVSAGDWETAVESAEETLSFESGNASAKSILSDWRKKVFIETIGLVSGVGLIFAGLSGLYTLFFEKGLHKIMAAGVSGVMYAGIGVGLGFALLPLTRRMFQKKIRWGVCVGAPLVFMLLFLGVTRGLLAWNPLKAFDQKSLKKEMKEKLKHGVGNRYWEPAHRDLQDLYDKYKDTQVDLSKLNEDLAKMEMLKTKMEKLTREFQEKLDKIYYSNKYVPTKVKQIQKLKEYYSLRGVDVSPADKMLKELKSRKTKNISRTRPRGRISIVPAKSKKSSVGKSKKKKKKKKTKKKKRKKKTKKKSKKRKSWP